MNPHSTKFFPLNRCLSAVSYALMLLFPFISNAQSATLYELVNDYSKYDSCPDPGKYHISQRTITHDDLVAHESETRTEKYDHEGHLLSFIARSVDSSGAVSTFAHYYTYDRQGRMVSDSGVYDTVSSFMTMRHMTTVEYDSARSLAVQHFNEFGHEYMEYAFYDSTATVIAQGRLEENGDTTWKEHSDDNCVITIDRLRDGNGVLQVIDSSVSCYTRFQDTRRSFFSNYQYETVTEETRYNGRHQPIVELSWLDDSVLRDSSNYNYTAHGQLLTEVYYIFPRTGFNNDTDTIAWHTKYTYDRKGHVQTETTWSTLVPQTVYLKRYTYDKKGLRIRMTDSVQDAQGKETLVSDEKWEYERW